jgi:hypothetical protein
MKRNCSESLNYRICGLRYEAGIAKTIYRIKIHLKLIWVDTIHRLTKVYRNIPLS